MIISVSQTRWSKFQMHNNWKFLHSRNVFSHTHTTMCTLRLVTWNVHGADCREKRLKIFNQLKKLQADVVLLQDTHRSVTATDEYKQL